MVRLSQLRLNENKFSGPIDTALISTWNAAKMTQADFEFNFFTGNVPVLCNLRFLDISHNHFNGGQPSDLACMTFKTPGLWLGSPHTACASRFSRLNSCELYDRAGLQQACQLS